MFVECCVLNSRLYVVYSTNTTNRTSYGKITRKFATLNDNLKTKKFKDY